MLIDTIKTDFLHARKARNKETSMAFNILIGECERLYKTPTDAEVEAVGRKILKNARIAIDYQYSLAAAVEIEVLEHYFPDKTISDDVKLVASRIVLDNPDRELNDKTVGWFVGKVMQETKGSADAAAVRDYLLNK